MLVLQDIYTHFIACWNEGEMYTDSTERSLVARSYVSEVVITSGCERGSVCDRDGGHQLCTHTWLKLGLGR